MSDTADRCRQFAKRAAAEFLREQENNAPIAPDERNPACVLAQNKQGRWMRLDFTPFQASVKRADAAGFFSAVGGTNELLTAYEKARRALPFEMDISHGMDRVSAYASQFLDAILARASTLSDHQARGIAAFVAPLDIYTSVKACESLFYSHADLALLELAEQQDWQLHFDHLAMRCGCDTYRDAQRVVQLLVDHHGYAPAQLKSEVFYQFPDGWNAYPLYKILDNGQVLRLFIDQSDGSRPAQIIQHWNYVYGYTAHHLGIRASMVNTDGHRQSVRLSQLIESLQDKKVQVMTPTGMYTGGLLLQVFTKPQLNMDLPDDVLSHLTAVQPELTTTIRNAKLLEMVARRECPIHLAQDYFALYGLRYDADLPLHSVTYYQYFLPNQAAHVINSSVQAQSA